MAGTQHLWLFIVSGLLLNITPGPDSLFIMARSATQGWRAGFVACWGVGSGVFVHVFAAALGLSALLATSATAFAVVKVIGAAYLVWIGIGMLRARGEAAQAVDVAPRVLRYRDIFRQGFLTNVLNPKVALFFLAFVPQFIAPDAPSKPLAFIVLGAIFDINGMLWCHALALFTAFASRRLNVDAAVGRWLNRTMGAVFVALGAKLALASR
ncbi:LysE family translocator [Scleromatobacter humisilvae]|uniref:LysE family translocator n=1 Tax=Scleromatobacter humisilvae TaxID=2897159 RepID=A0A9X2C358_9BURK|nr:LysE family translocator [Scleromatobacter humisilvae]MCK9689671.1 LysE family translocator [Scleromatobacter humisilvae]